MPALPGGDLLSFQLADNALRNLSHDADLCSNQVGLGEFQRFLDPRIDFDLHGVAMNPVRDFVVAVAALEKGHGGIQCAAPRHREKGRPARPLWIKIETKSKI